MQIPSFQAVRFRQLALGTWFWMQRPTPSGVTLSFGVRLKFERDEGYADTDDAVVLFSPGDAPTFFSNPSFSRDTLTEKAPLRLEVDADIRNAVWENEANRAPEGSMILVDDRWFVTVKSADQYHPTAYLEFSNGTPMLVRRRPQGSMVAFHQWKLVRASDGTLVYDHGAAKTAMLDLMRSEQNRR